MYVLPLILSLGVSFESMLFTANQWLGLGYCDGNQMSVSFLHFTEECKLDDPNCMECVFDASGNPICGECTGGFELGADGKCSAPGTTSQSGSSCDTGCIVGIVLAILGAIIMAVVVALVVYAVYSYLSNPATKLAKAGTEGLNG